jgi:hypothetical protein
MLVRCKDVDTLKDDLLLGAAALAVFFFGVNTSSARRAIYHQYEHGRLLGAFKYGSLLAARKSTALAAMWAAETKGLDEATVRLMELHLQLNELASALLECGSHQTDVAKLRLLLAATGETIAAATELRGTPRQTIAKRANVIERSA